MKSAKTLWFCLAVVAQMAVLSGMWVKAEIPLWSGKEVKVEVLPVDPRSLFRGQYARLYYDIGNVKSDNPIKPDQLRQGEVVYRKLIKDDNGVYQKGELILDKPKQGVFIRGRLDKSRYSFRILYGIEAYFAPEAKALALEKQLRDGAVAVLKITDSGQAGILTVEPKPRLQPDS